MNKEVFSVHKLGEEPKSYLYWINQSPEKRLDAIEFLRKNIVIHPKNLEIIIQGQGLSFK